MSTAKLDGKESAGKQANTSLKRRFIETHWASEGSFLQKPYVTVRTPEECPESILDYFQLDPRTQQSYSPSEKLLQAQVYLHEIDEGARYLMREKKQQQARVLLDFSNGLRPAARMEMLRQSLRNPTNPEPAQQVRKTYKARCNQVGAVRCEFNRHSVTAVTEIGYGYKPCNEDAFMVDSQRKVLALADGMGGHVGGHIASGIAIDFFEYALRKGASLEAALTLANAAILTRSKSDPRLGGTRPMGCTFAAVEIEQRQIKVAYVGDTKVMVLRKGAIIDQTQDHTQGQMLLAEGLVDIETAFDLNHILNRSLGTDIIRPNRDVSSNDWELQNGDRVLLATDGITDNFFDEYFCLDELAQLACAGTLLQAANLVIDTALSRMIAGTLPYGRASKCDNLSLILMEFRE